MSLSAGTAFIDILPRMTGFIAGMQKGMAGIANKVGNLGSKLTKGLTLPIVGLGAVAVHMASDFEDSMSKIVGLVGVSQEQVDQWSDEILRMGDELPQAPKELADALYFITSAGFDGAAAMRVLDASAKAAAAGLGDTMTVADAVTSAVNAYGEKTLSAAEATDILTGAVRLGKAEASSIAPVLGSLLPTASELGVSFNDVAAAIAAMTRTGDSAATAATKTNAIFSAMVKTTNQQEQAFKDAGTSSKELRKSLAERGLLPTLLDLRDAVDGDVAALAEMFPNVRALRGVLSLTGNQADINAEIFRDLSDATGEAARAFKVASETSEFQFGQMKATLSAAAIAFGELLLPAVTSVARAIAKFGLWLVSLPEGVKKTILMIAGLVAAIGPLLLVVKYLILAFSPLGLLIAGIAIAALTIVKNWKKIGPVVMPIVNRIKEAILNAWRALQRFIRDLDWKKIWNSFGKVANVIGNAFGAVVRWAKKLWNDLKPVRDFLGDWAKSIGGDLIKAFKMLGQVWKDDIMPALKDLWEGLQKLWDPAGKAVVGLLVLLFVGTMKLVSMALPYLIKAIGIVVRSLAALFNFIASIVQALARLPGRIIAFFKAIPGAITAFIKAIPGFIGKVLAFIGKVAVYALALIISFVAWVFSLVAKAIGAIIEWFMALPGKIVSFIAKLPEMISNFFKSSSERSKKMLDGIIDWFKKLPGKIVSLLGKLVGLIAKIAGKIVELFAKGAQKIIDWFSKLPGRLIDLFQKVLSWLASLPGKVANFFSRMVDKALNIAGKILNWFKELPGKIVNFLSSLPEKFGNVIRGMANAAIKWWNQLDLQIEFTLPDIKGVPGLDGQHISTPDLIPDVGYLAAGGIVMGPTLSWIGERGPEAVIPLDQWPFSNDGMTLDITDSNLGLVMRGTVRDENRYAESRRRASR